MEFIVSTEILNAALTVVKPTFGSDTVPVLNSIHFQADMNGTVTCRSANGIETTMRTFQARVGLPGEACIDGYVLTRIVGTFDKGDVTVSVGANGLDAIVTHSKGDVQIQGLDPSHFPPHNDFQEDTSFTIPSKELAKAIKLVDFARIKKPGTSDIKLGGVGMVIENGRVTVASCDRKRAAKFEFDAPQASDINIVLDVGILRGIAAVDGNIAVRLADNGICLETNETSYQGPVLASKYPDVKRFFPGQAPFTAVVPTAALADVLERVTILAAASKSDADADLSFDPVTGLEVKFNSKSGKINEMVIGSTYTGTTPFNIKVNVTMILDGVNRVEKDNIDILLSAPERPLVFYPENEHEFGFFAMAVV